VNETARAGSIRTDITVCVAILTILGLQILVAYDGGAFGRHAIEILGLAILQAGLGLLFFMHLLSEKRSLVFALILLPLSILLLMNAFWSDSFRIIQMRPWAS
jgi:cytochrome c oxidase subunit IV